MKAIKALPKEGEALMDIVLLLIRLLLAVIFIVSGLAKLVDRSGSRQAMLDFGVPARLAVPSAFLLPLIELVVAAALILTISAWWGGLGALALLLLFTTAVGYHLTRGHTPKCHCFGQASSEPIGWSTLVRNLILSALAGIIVGFGHTSADTSIIEWLGTMTVVQRVELGIGALVVALLAVGVVILLQLLRQQGHLLQRLEALEGKLVGNGIKTMAETLSPVVADTPAPAFRLPDLSGNLVTLDALLSSGRPVLLIFSDPGCGPCNSLLPEIGRWQRDYASKLTLALISRSTPEANRDKASQHGIALVLLQQDREVAEAYQAHGTPCAVLIHSDGIIRSLLACGAEKIRELVAQAVDLPVIKSLPVAPSRGNGHMLPMAAPHRNGATAGLPSQSHKLQIGEIAPAFTLPDLNGQRISLADFRGKQTLLLFWNPGCGFCEQMLPDLKDWKAESPQGELTLLVISTRNVNENRALGLHSPVLLDEGFTVGPTFGVHGTPMAVLIDAEGKIASEVASGAPAVLALARSNQILA
jgi:methylamine dehydrogenase accessory protein MauD